MRLRSLLAIFVVQALLWHGLEAKSIRKGRDSSITVDNTPNKKDVVIYSASSPTEVKVYHPPLLAAPPAATAPHVLAPQQNNAYQPPLLLAQSNDYKPLISSSQTQSVRYQAPSNSAQLQGIPLVHASSQPTAPASQSYSAPLLASAQTGNLNTLTLQQRPRQGFSYSGDHGVSNQFNEQPTVQAESQPKPSAVASSSTGSGGQNDEYVVYYYYYYDNDTAANGSSNFDDIPSLESYDTDKTAKEPEKSASARTLAADVNSLTVNNQEKKRPQDSSISSQPRSVSSSNSNQPPFIRSDKPSSTPEELAVQPLKPISNVFRYGTNEVPRFPILPNFVVSEAPVVTRTAHTLTSSSLPESIPTTQAPGNLGVLPGVQTIPNSDHDIDEANNVVDQPSNFKHEEEKVVEEPTTTTSTEPPTTTEVPTTTTERTRRRPGTGNRRRFNPSPSFSSNRRQSPSRSSSTTSSTVTTPTSGPPSTRGAFRGSSRTRQRPTISANRSRNTFSRNTPLSNDNEETKSTASSTATSSTTARPRFGSSSSSRRFSSTRTRSPSSGTTRSTTTTTTTLRPRPAPRPRPNLISRSRPPRPGLFRSRTPVEPEDSEPTTPTPETVTEEEPSPSSLNDAVSAEENETVEDTKDEDETSDVETEAPVTTEKNRFSALFRPRNRSTLNRPRPPIGRRSR